MTYTKFYRYKNSVLSKLNQENITTLKSWIKYQRTDNLDKLVYFGLASALMVGGIILNSFIFGGL